MEPAYRRGTVARACEQCGGSAILPLRDAAASGGKRALLSSFTIPGAAPSRASTARGMSTSIPHFFEPREIAGCGCYGAFSAAPGMASGTYAVRYLRLFARNQASAAMHTSISPAARGAARIPRYCIAGEVVSGDLRPSSRILKPRIPPFTAWAIFPMRISALRRRLWIAV